MKKLVVMLVVGAVVCLSTLLQAGITSFPISIASGDQTNPSINGDTVVWLDHSTYQVHFKNLYED